MSAPPFRGAGSLDDSSICYDVALFGIRDSSAICLSEYYAIVDFATCAIWALRKTSPPNGSPHIKGRSCHFIGLRREETKKSTELVAMSQKPPPSYLPPELLYQIALETDFHTLSNFRQACKTLYSLIPTPKTLIKKEINYLLSRYSVHESLGRALVRDYTISGTLRDIGKKGHLLLVKILIQKGARWGNAFAHAWIENANNSSSLSLYEKTGWDVDNGEASSISSSKTLTPTVMTSPECPLYGIWVWEVQVAAIKRWCKIFGKEGDTEILKSFVDVLGVFEVAAITRCPEMVREAETVWTEWTR